jgi:hypothetical protein
MPKPKRNKYGQLPVRQPEPPTNPQKHEKTWLPPPYSEGDLIYTVFKPVLFSIPCPAVAVKIEPSKYGLEGWVVWVETSDGLKMFTATHFSKYTPWEP